MVQLWEPWEPWEPWEFNYGNHATLDHSSCNLLIGSTMFVFGDYYEPRQIVEVYPWGSSISRRILTLPFFFQLVLVLTTLVWFIFVLIMMENVCVDQGNFQFLNFNKHLFQFGLETLCETQPNEY